MKYLNKKELERLYLEAFREISSEFPLGRIEPTESPDNLIHTSKEIVGVEITEVYREDGRQTLQSDEKIEEKLLDLVEVEYNKLNLSPVNVAMSFREKLKLKKGDRKKFVQKLVTTISDEVDHHSERHFQLRRPFDEVNHISILKLKKAKESHFYSRRGDFLSKDTIERIQDRIDQKEQKINNYRRKCDPIWLLAVIDGGNPSSFFEIGNSIGQHKFETSFDKVFLLEYWQSNLIELKT